MTDRVTAKLIRLQVDGELTPEQAAHLRRCLEAHPEDQAKAAGHGVFERRLRECVREALGVDVAAPASLNLRIRAAMAEMQSQEDDAEVAIARQAVATDAGARHRLLFSVFSNPRRANVLAVAATLAIVAGAILYGIFGQSIDDLPLPPQADLVAESAADASTAHDSLAARASAKVPFELSLAEQAQAELTDWMEVPAPVFDLESMGYRFVGGERGETPLSKRSGKLVYESMQAGDRKPKITITLVPKGPCQRACRDLPPNEWVEKGQTKCKHKVMCSTDNRLVYFVVCCNDRDMEAVTQRILAWPNGLNDRLPANPLR